MERAATNTARLGIVTQAPEQELKLLNKDELYNLQNIKERRGK